MHADPSAKTPVSPAESLSTQLQELEQDEGESQEAFLARAAGITAEYPEHDLNDDEIRAAAVLLPFWELRPHQPIKGRAYGMARRLAWTLMSQRPTLEQYNVDGERQVGIQSDNIVLLAKGALHASDLQAMLEIERANIEAKSIEQRKRDAQLKDQGTPKTQVPREKTGSQTTAPEAVESTAAEPETESPLSLNEGQEDVIRLLAFPSLKIARVLGVNEGTVKRRMAIAQNRNGMDREQLVKKAVKEGRVDMSLLPDRRKYKLRVLESRALRNHPFSGMETTAEALGIPEHQVSEVWRNIYVKIGIADEVMYGRHIYPTRTRAFLITTRDGTLRDGTAG